MSDDNAVETPEGSTAQLGLIEETLRPLLEKREVLGEELAAIETQATAKRNERKSVDKILRAGGLLEPTPVALPGSRTLAKRSGPSPRMVDTVLQAAAELKQDIFMIRPVAERAGKDLATAKKALERGREEGRVRLVGNRPMGDGNSRKALHYSLVQKGDS